MHAATAAYDHLLDRVRASRATERAELVRACAEQLGVTVQTVYRQLAARGWESGRKTRSDRGTTEMDAATLRPISRLLAAGRDKRGRVQTPLVEAVSMAKEQGLLPQDVSYGHVARRLREEGLGMRHMRAHEAGISRVTKYPNHVWLVDVSVAIQWYFRDPRGKKLQLLPNAGQSLYEGKLGHIKALRRVIHRYLAVDHYSGAWYVRYYYSAGENPIDMVDFLWRAAAAKDLPHYPFRGLPLRIVADQGAPFKSSLVQELLRAAGVMLELHAPGNAKASGAVESRHRHWGTRFEGRLALNPAKDIGELNSLALAFCARENANRVHSRHGKPPIRLWATIGEEQLREAPDMDTWLQLAATRPYEATLDGRLWLRARGQAWEVSGDHIFRGQKVRYRLAPFMPQGIRVWDEHNRELGVTRIERDAAGFATTGRIQVWDDPSEAGATAPRTPARKVALAQEEEPLRIESVFGPLELPMVPVLAPMGQPWSGPAASPELEAEPMLSREDALEEVSARLGRPLGADAAWWHDAVGSGVTMSELDALLVGFHPQQRLRSTA